MNCCKDKNAIQDDCLENNDKNFTENFKKEESGIKKRKIIIHYNKKIENEHEFHLLPDFIINSFTSKNNINEKELQKETEENHHFIPDLSFFKAFQPKYIIHGYLMKYVEWQKKKWKDRLYYPYSMYGFFTILSGFTSYGLYESYPYSLYILLFGAFITISTYEFSNINKKD